jgi:DNA-binding transcriptional LysR family regulator
MVVDLKRLSHLVALADESHFARAAERVHLSQPAFSRSIQLLETQVGMRLFDRETGDVKPTPAGLFLVDRARRLLSRRATCSATPSSTATRRWATQRSAPARFRPRPSCRA